MTKNKQPSDVMTATASPAPEPNDPVVVPFNRGSNQSGMRAYNERLVLSLVRRHGSLSKTEIARMTGLSAQTVSVIMRALESDSLLVRGEPIRGRRGQPSVPLSLNADGAFFFGVKIGRRSFDLVLVDFLGGVRSAFHRSYAYPLPEAILGFVAEGVRSAILALPAAHRPRVAGLGIAMPFELWNWAEEVGAPEAAMAAWRDIDIREEVAALVSYPVYLQNDATAACGAELAFGDHSGLQDFIYFYIGTFVGGGIVLNGGLYSGKSGNAGALGSMPVPGDGARSGQLIDLASVFGLEKVLLDHGVDPSALWAADGDWSAYEGFYGEWIARAARGLAHAIAAASSVIDFEAALIDGAFPAAIRAGLVEAVRDEIGRLDLQGIRPPDIRPGTIGASARALGGASLPLSERYLIDQNTLMRTG